MKRKKFFQKIIDEAPGCAMAYWGVAMANFHPLWTPPSEKELVKGLKAIEIARSINSKSSREETYINAITSYYSEWDKTDHPTRCKKFARAMEGLYRQDTTDIEAAVLYALSLNAAADPADKTFANQLKAGKLLQALYATHPDHPGIVHYIIHTYDSPGLASLALPAARRYASVAPSSAHALHMPSHIFTRLGLWKECTSSNLESIAAAKCYAASARITGHWDEELHAQDYLVYSYLQMGNNKLAKAQVDYINSIKDVNPLNFKVAYAFAAIPSRYVLENKLWNEAAHLNIQRENVPWKNFLWQEAIVHFTRLMGAVHTNNPDSAKIELKRLYSIHDTLTAQKDTYKAGQVFIQIKTGEAWMKAAAGKKEEAIGLMKLAAELEDKTEKHPVTPGEVIPAKEFLGDLYLQLVQPVAALKAYEENLVKHPGRFNGLYGAGLAAEKSGDFKKAVFYYAQLVNNAKEVLSARPEIERAQKYLAMHH